MAEVENRALGALLTIACHPECPIKCKNTHGVSHGIRAHETNPVRKSLNGMRRPYQYKATTAYGFQIASGGREPCRTTRIHLGPPDLSLEAAQFASGPRENGLSGGLRHEFAGSAGPKVLIFSRLGGRLSHLWASWGWSMKNLLSRALRRGSSGGPNFVRNPLNH